MTKFPRSIPCQLVCVLISLGAGCALAPQCLADSPQKQWVTQGADGRLHYQADDKGNTIPDFSHAGYGGGGVSLPDVPVQKTVKPSGQDDTAAIQSAIDAVAALPLKDGFRGAVLLESGTFSCSNTLNLSQAGVVLRWFRLG